MTAPTILAVTAQPPSALSIEWSTGEALQTDIEAEIDRAPWLQPLRDPLQFTKVAIGPAGESVTWGDGMSLDAWLLYGLGRMQAGLTIPEWFEERAKNEKEQQRWKKHRNWLYALEVWDEFGAVHPFMVAQIEGLRDRDGDELPIEIRRFFADLVQWKRDKPRKPRAEVLLPTSLVKERFELEMLDEQIRRHENPDNASSETPTEAALKATAKAFSGAGEVSVDRISSIVYRRKRETKESQPSSNVRKFKNGKPA